MDKKEADIIAVEFEEEKGGNEAGQFEEPRCIYNNDQKKEARSYEVDSASTFKHKGESEILADQHENASFPLDSKNKEPKNDDESVNTATYSNASGSTLQNNKEEQQTASRNEYPKNSRISKPQENDGREGQREATTSFIRPPNAPSFNQSMKYATETVVWIFYHSIILAIIPTVIIMIMYGSTWFFPISNENMMIYFASTNAFYHICFYAATSGVFIYMFGKRRVFHLVYKLAIPLCLAHISFSALGIYWQFSLLWVGCYVSFFSFCFLMMRNISAKSQCEKSTEEASNPYDALASDGTPMAIKKGVVPAFFLLYLVVTYIVPYCMDSGIFIRIVGRIFVLPIIFGIADTYMNSQIMNKSDDCLQFRMIPGNLASIIFLSILRFMISYSSSVYDTFVMSSSSGFFEVVLWSSHIPRSIYSMKIMGYLKSRMSISMCRSNRVKNLDSVFPQSLNANSRNEPPPNDEQIAQIEPLELSIEGFKRLFIRLNQEDNTTRHLISHRTNRSVILCMSEIQFIIFLPIILYLCKPIKNYLTFQPTSTLTQFFASVLIQLPIELLTQTASLCLESYLYGIKVPVEKSIKYSLNPLIILQYALMSLSVMYISTNAFWITPENWPDK